MIGINKGWDSKRADKGGGYGILLIYRVLQVFMTNPFSCSFFNTMAREVFEHINISYFKKFLETSKFQKWEIFNCGIENSWIQGGL